MIIDLLRLEHRNIEKLLLVLEQELSVFDRGERPDYEVIWAVIAYFQVFPDAYHHPQENAVFEKLKVRDPAAAAKIGDLAAEHRTGAEHLRRIAQAVESVLMDQEISRHTVDDIIRDFIVFERRHIAMEERYFFPAAAEALQPRDWAEIASSRSASQQDPLFSATAEERFKVVRRHILQLEQDAEAERARRQERKREETTHDSPDRASIEAPTRPAVEPSAAAELSARQSAVLQALRTKMDANQRVEEKAAVLAEAANIPLGSLHSVLQSLEKKQLIKTARAGSARAPAVYQVL